jgi:DNA polymerase (family 10)
MNLPQAEAVANEVMDRLRPCCSKIAVAGSVRRKKGWVNDIDIVCIPSNQGAFLAAVHSLGAKVKEGPAIMSRRLPVGIDVEFYIANEITWATLLLIRTGSKEHNIKLCSLAKRKGMVLHADGRGLYHAEAGNPEFRLLCPTEADIFKHLGMEWVKPEDRER